MRWTTKEVEYLKNNFHIKTYKEIAEVLKRQVSSVIAKSYDLRLQVDKKDTLWSEDELSLLIKQHHSFTVSQLADKLKRTKASVRAKMWVLNLRPLKKNKVSGKGKVKKYLDVDVNDLRIIEKKYGSLRGMIEAIAEILRNEQI